LEIRRVVMSLASLPDPPKMSTDEGIFEMGDGRYLDVKV
jgi:hypothetical protein